MSTVATFTTDEFEHMIACGAFTGPNEKRVELIRGELRAMSPTGVDHEELLDWLIDWSFDTVDRKAVQVRVQESLGIPELETIPFPDLAWVRRHRVRRRRPRPSDVLPCSSTPRCASSPFSSWRAPRSEHGRLVQTKTW